MLTGEVPAPWSHIMVQSDTRPPFGKDRLSESILE